MEVDLRRKERIQCEAYRQALSLLDVARSILRRGDLPDAAFDAVSKDLRSSLNDLETRIAGPLEPRKGSKPSTHPKVDQREPIHIYLDESGTSGNPSEVPCFALSGIVVTPQASLDYVQRADAVKDRHFDRSDLAFHEPHIRRGDRDRKQRIDYSFGGDAVLRAAFLADFRALIEATSFELFGTVIRVQAFIDQFGSARPNPYLPAGVYDAAIMMLMERAARYIGDLPVRSFAKIHFESIGAKEDAERQLLFSDLLVHGTEFVSEKHFRSWLDCGCEFESKGGSSIAEIADLCARDLFERVRSDFAIDPPYWDILLPRIWSSGDLNRGQSGLKVFPDADVRDLVMQERRRASEMKTAAGSPSAAV